MRVLAGHLPCTIRFWPLPVVQRSTATEQSGDSIEVDRIHQTAGQGPASGIRASNSRGGSAVDTRCHRRPRTFRRDSAATISRDPRLRPQRVRLLAAITIRACCPEFQSFRKALVSQFRLIVRHTDGLAAFEPHRRLAKSNCRLHSPCHAPILGCRHAPKPTRKPLVRYARQILLNRSHVVPFS